MLQKSKFTTILSDFPYLSNNPNLPNCVHPDYLDNLSILDELNDLYQGDVLWLRNGVIVDSQKIVKYLPPTKSEQRFPDLYKEKVNRARFRQFFKETVDRDYAGLLSQFNITDFPEDERYLDNIDLKGNDIKTFFKECDKLTLKDGSCFVYVDIPRRDSDTLTEYQRKELQIRPYFVRIDRSNLINWKHQITNGVERLVSITVLEQILVEKGQFGQEYQIRYRIITENDYRVYLIEGDKIGIIDEGVTNLGYIPLVGYSLTSANAFSAEASLRSLALLCKDWYQLNSERRELIHATQPTLLVKKNKYSTEEDQTNVFFEIGAHSALILSTTEDASWMEANGAGIKPIETLIAEIEDQVKELSLGFLSGSLVPKTATEAQLDAAQAESNLAGMVAQKQSAIMSCFDLYFAYYGQDNPIDIQMSDSLLKPIKEWSIKEVMDAVTSGFMSRGFGMNILRYSGAFPEQIEDEDIEKELMLTGESLTNTPNVNPILFEDVTNGENQAESPTNQGNNQDNPS